MGSVSTRSLDGSEPTRTSASSVDTLRPLSGPDATSTDHWCSSTRVAFFSGAVMDSVASKDRSFMDGVAFYHSEGVAPLGAAVYG